MVIAIWIIGIYILSIFYCRFICYFVTTKLPNKSEWFEWDIKTWFIPLISPVAMTYMLLYELKIA